MNEIQLSMRCEPKGEEFRKLLAEALRFCMTFSVVQRLELKANQRCASFLRDLQEKLVEIKDTDMWQGTKLIGGLARLYRYRLDKDSIEILANYSNGLYEFLQPNLPEDICLERSDGSPFLVTISHERDAYFLLNNGEEEVVATWEWASFIPRSYLGSQ